MLAKLNAPIRLRYSFSFEKAILMGARSLRAMGWHGDEPASSVTHGVDCGNFLGVARLSRMTTMLGANSGTQTVSK